ncbi:MAG: MFS transporter [Christensenellales bacterium]
MSSRADRYPWHFGLPIALYYATLGIFQGYTAKYFQQVGIAANSPQMMWLMVSAPLVALVAQPLWGLAGDRLRWRNSAILVMGLASAALMALLPLAGGAFPLMMAISCLFAAFFTSIQPLGDSIILESLLNRRAAFGPVRLMGSLAYALTNLVLAGYFEGRYHLVPWGTVLFTLLLTLAMRVLPKTAGHQRGRRPVPMRQALRVPHMIPLLMMTTGLQLAMGYFYSYFTLHFTSLPGGSSGLLGIGYAVSALCELPFLIFSERLYRRFGTGRLMVFSALLLTFRFLIMGLAGSAQWLVFSQIFHGGGFIVITVSMAKYINDTIPDELKSAGQMLLALLGYGLARVFGTFVGAAISGLTGGPAGGFLAMSGLCLLCFVLGGLHFFRLPPMNGLPLTAQGRGV